MEAGGLGLMWSQWTERGATCPESGNRSAILSNSTCWLFLLSPHFISTCRDIAGASHGRREYTVGQYVVDLPSFENLAIPLFRKVRQQGAFKNYPPQYITGSETLSFNKPSDL